MVKKVKKKETDLIEAEMNKDLGIETPKAEDLESKGLCYIG
jgi:hypothetical protein